MFKNEIKKDLMIIYMFRNALATLVIAIASFFISIMLYYRCDISEAFKRLFVYDIYTTLYFIMLWIFDYILFEISKIAYDIYEEKVTFIPCIALGIIGVLVWFIPMLDLFKYNFSFLAILICIRMVREMWKRTPELFKMVHKFIDKIKKRPESGLE
ncbi:MAG: hypothetical protein RR630_03000 [Coprobacillus sp.]